MPNEALKLDGQEVVTPSDVGQGDATGRSDDLAALGASFGPNSCDFEEVPAFIMDGPPSDDLPTHFTTLLNPDAIAALARKRTEGNLACDHGHLLSRLADS